MNPLVLLAEDDRAVRDALVRSLELEGHQVLAVGDGIDALAVLDRTPVDLVILDVRMPGCDGFETCRRLRERGHAVPVLMLTARTEIADRVTGLDAGADDYLAKPFALDELLARIRALLRRPASVATEPATDRPLLTVADLRVDELARRAWRGSQELELTKTEFDLLLELVLHAGQVLTHGQLLDRVWGFDMDPESKTLAVYIGYLRRKTEDGGAVRLIHTVRGVGYTLRAP